MAPISEQGRTKRQVVTRVGITAAILVITWYVLSGRLDLLHFGSGVVVAVVVAYNFRDWGDRLRFRPLRFLLFIPWLAGQVIRSNLRVARAVLSRRLDIAPTFISAVPHVRGSRALTLLGASITLTPGTLTVDVGEDEIFVHALDRSSTADIERGVMARHVAPLFDDGAA